MWCVIPYARVVLVIDLQCTRSISEVTSRSLRTTTTTTTSFRPFDLLRAPSNIVERRKAAGHIGTISSMHFVVGLAGSTSGTWLALLLRKLPEMVLRIAEVHVLFGRLSRSV